MDTKQQPDLLPPRLTDLRRQILKAVPCVPDTSLVRGELAAMSFPQLISTYLNWKDRSLSPRARRTMIWNGMQAYSRRAIDWERIVKIMELSNNGESLERYLSRRARSHGYVPKSAEQRGIEWGDKDLALNAYSVHHLHLTPANVTGKRSGDSNELLFVAASRDTLTLLMVGNHSSFDDGTLFDAVTAFRADSDFWIRGVLPARERLSAKESAKLIRHGVMVTGNHQDKLVPTALLSSMGSGLWHTRHADRIVITLEGWEPILDDRARYEDAFKQKDWIPDEPVWRWSFHYGDLYLVETRTGAAALVLPWER